jgi:hypothetical protein
VYRAYALNVVSMEAYELKPEKTAQPDKLRTAFKELCSRRRDSNQLTMIWLRQQPDGGWVATSEPPIMVRTAETPMQPAQERCAYCEQPISPARGEKK